MGDRKLNEDELLNLLVNGVDNEDLKNADAKLAEAEANLTQLNQGEKEAIENLNIALNTLQKVTIKNKNTTTNITNFVKKMTDKIKALTKITNAEKKEAVVAEGGSISTNNSIRKQIFTDLKYITKYLKYKTKYIVFKSKHQFN